MTAITIHDRAESKRQVAPASLWLVLSLLLLLGGCASAPLDVPRDPSHAIDPDAANIRAPGVEAWLGGRTDINGFYPLLEGFDAFGARLALMDGARATIDAQYFLMKQFYARSLPPYLAEADLLVDSPEKLVSPVATEHQAVGTALRDAMAAAEQEILIYTPYFIPGDGGMDFIRGLTGRGVRVVVVTNSLATNNHTAVYSAYRRYRKALLEAGVELWEARADAARAAPDSNEDADGDGYLTLHSKALVIDRQRLFAGSVNLDPRSIRINTEMGLLIDSKDLGGTLSAGALERLPTWAYRVVLDDRGRVRWTATIDGREVVETHAPQTSVWDRLSAWIQGIAPEGQL